MSKLELKVLSSEDGLVAVATRIGRVSLASALPEMLTAGTLVGTLTTLRTTTFLTLPDGGPWRFDGAVVAARDTGVGVGTPLLKLRLWDESQTGATDGEGDAAGQLFRSPMSGQYYRRPAPDQPPFVEVGTIVEAGTQIGLVEVMKFFYPLVFEGKGRWRVIDVVVGETASLDAGDAVLRIEAVAP